MSSPQKPPVPPWIPQRPAPARPQVVYVPRPSEGAGAIRAGWVLNGLVLLLTVVLMAGLALQIRRMVAINGGAPASGLDVASLVAMFGGGGIVGAIMALAEVALFVIVIVGMVQGRVGAALVLFVASLINLLCCAAAISWGAPALLAWEIGRAQPAGGMQTDGAARKIGGGFSPAPVGSW